MTAPSSSNRHDRPCRPGFRGAFISLEAAIGVMLLLIVMNFAVKNSIRLYTHVQLEEAATRLVRDAARVTPWPPNGMTMTDFTNQAGDVVGKTEYTWTASGVIVEVTLNSSGLTASRQLPRETP